MHSETLMTFIAVGLETAAAIAIAIGAIDGAARLVASLLHRASTARSLKDAWLRFAVWLLFGLELALGADIVRSALSPSWTEIGQLAAIAAIRTLLNLFLERDIEQASGRAPPPTGREVRGNGPDHRDDRGDPRPVHP